MNMREIEVFKPYANEFPEHLLAEADEAVVTAWQAAETLRIAKQREEILGVYAMQRIDSAWFELLGVVVAQPARHQGLGRWLVGHAIGVAESKGGRHLRVRASGGSRLFAAMGFARDARGLYFDMIQE